MQNRMLTCFIIAALTQVIGSAQAQTNKKAASGSKPTQGSKPITEPKSPNFSRLFQNPSNNNAYEDWVMASDLIQNNEDVEAALQPGATLSFKRHVLAEPSVRQALALLRAGLDKPMLSPHEDYNENTILPELVQFRNLGRLLRMEQYCDFAEGRVDSAITCLRVGLAFGYRIQIDNLISGLIGLAVSTGMLDDFARHYEQLSVIQCYQVQRIVEEFLKAENPEMHLLAFEKSMALKMLETRRNDAKSMLELLNIFDVKKHPEDAPDVEAVRELLSTRPQEANTLIDETKARVSAVYDQALHNLTLPISQRMQLERDRTISPTASLSRLLATNTPVVNDRYTGYQAKLRLLGVHALIHRYRWEHNALPGGLSELQADELVNDPFTGDQITYKRDGERYTLYSQGPFKRDDTGQEVYKERVPVKLLP